MATAAAAWETLDGQAAMAGVDLMDLTPVRLCNLVWSKMRAGAKDDDDWRKTVTQLTRPLPGTRPSVALREFRRLNLS